MHHAVYVPPHTMTNTTRIGLGALLLIAWTGVIRTCAGDAPKTSGNQAPADASTPPPAEEPRPTEVADLSRPTVSKWIEDGDVSVMDGLVTGISALDAEEALPTLHGSQKPLLIVRCTPKHRMEIYVNLHVPLRSYDGDETEIQYRFDSNPPTTQRWQLGEDNNVVFAPRSRELYDRMVKAERLLVHFQAFVGPGRIATFDVRGLKQSSKQLTGCLKKR